MLFAVFAHAQSGGVGVWIGTIIPVANGGTALQALGTANQQLRVNAGATALEYFTASGGGSGDITNGGNTTGAAITIGTNDAFDLNLETNGVVRQSMTGGASTGGAQTFTNVTATTAGVEDVITATSNSTGTTEANFGPRIRLQGESTTTDNQDMGGIGAIWTTATHASRTSAVPIYGVNNAGALGELARFSGATAPVLRIASAVGTAGTTTYGNAGITPGTSFVVGNNAQQVTIGGSSGVAILPKSG